MLLAMSLYRIMCGGWVSIVLSTLPGAAELGLVKCKVEGV